MGAIRRGACAAAAILVVTTLAACQNGAADGPSRAAPSAVASTGQPPDAKCAAVPSAPKRQMRGMWISTFRNLDWPSRPGLPVATQKRELTAYLDAAVRMRMNAVFVQVRDRADAFYKSSYEPWSQALTGTPGRDPGYDPLAFLATEAHRRNLELHAWFNPFQVTTEGDKPLPANHPAVVHKGWTHRFQGRLYYDPGIPAVRSFVEGVINEVVRKYDIDGVHFDDHFYPYPQPGQRFADDATYKKYGKGQGKGTWRRANVDAFVREVGQQTHKAKPWVRYGISPFGIWRNTSSDPAGSATSGLESYDSVYADTRKWVREGWVDYVAPQLYWSLGDKVASYKTLVRWWNGLVAQAPKDHPVQLYIGQAAYRVNKTSTDSAFRSGKELTRLLKENQGQSRVDGDIFFSARDLVANRLGMTDDLVSGPYAHPALTPVDTGAPDGAPAAVAGLRAARDGGDVRLRWSPAAGATSYAVYRFSKAPGRCGFADGKHLVAVVRTPAYTDHAKSGHYYVTAVDRASRESAAGPAAVVG
ncbi:MAG TPA: family 10 glycosylhydrolase [Streptosporangiaceae bacterium]|jgi:uncharacterized lipoprotein YddW (UPF0748 family)